MKTPTAVAKWSEMYQINPQLWSSIFSLSFDTCEETILQTFQYKILNRFFPCNYVLAKWYDDILSSCAYCPTASDTLQHYFYLCPDVCHFWLALKRWWHGLTEFSFDLRESDILLGILNPNNDINIDILNYCILVGKWYIYQTKQNNSQIFFFNYLSTLKSKLEILETVYIERNKVKVFTDKWSFVYDNV